MLKQKASKNAYAEIYERFSDIKDTMVSEFLSGKFVAGQPWKLIPASLVKHIWESFTKMGFVRDMKSLDKILDQMIENVARIEINNIVSGHTQLPMESVLEEYFGEDDPRITEHQESFVDWAVDLPGGGWRISDYGIPKIVDNLALAIEAPSAEQKLIYIDMALNVCHQRSDLASWFIEGGSFTLSGISGQGLTQ